jgi:disulfide bond formation protein DsbB
MNMEWYTFGLDRILMFLFAVFSALVIVLAVMFGKDERGPKKYIQMN